MERLTDLVDDELAVSDECVVPLPEVRQRAAQALMVPEQGRMGGLEGRQSLGFRLEPLIRPREGSSTRSWSSVSTHTAADNGTSAPG